MNVLITSMRMSRTPSIPGTVRPSPLSRGTVRAFGPPALRLSLSVAPPFSLGVPHEPRLRRAYDTLC
jgi:hypothetical protein